MLTILFESYEYVLMNLIQQTAVPFLQSYDFPQDVGRVIFNFLNVLDIVNATVTCKAWARVITHQKNAPYWQAILLKRYGIISAQPYADFVLHRTFFQGELMRISTLVQNVAQDIPYPQYYFNKIELRGTHVLVCFPAFVKVWEVRSEMRCIATATVSMYSRACLWLNKLANLGPTISLKNLTEDSDIQKISLNGYHTNTPNLLLSWGEKLISGDWSGNIFVWNHNGDCIQKIKGEGGYNAFQEVNGDELITITEFGGVELFDLNSGQRKWRTYSPDKDLRGVKVTKDKIIIKHISRVMVLDRSTGADLLTIYHHNHPLQIAVYDREPNWIIHGTSTKISIQDVQKNQLVNYNIVPTFIQEIDEPIDQMKVIGDRLITSSGNSFKTWCLLGGSIQFERNLECTVSMFCGSGDQIIIADKNNTIWKWDLGEIDSMPIVIAQNLTGKITNMFLQELKLVVTLSDSTIAIWMPPEGIKRRKIP